MEVVCGCRSRRPTLVPQVVQTKVKESVPWVYGFGSRVDVLLRHSLDNPTTHLTSSMYMNRLPDCVFLSTQNNSGNREKGEHSSSVRTPVLPGGRGWW